MAEYKAPLTDAERRELNARYVVYYKALRQEILFERLVRLIKDHTAEFLGEVVQHDATQAAIDLAVKQWAIEQEIPEFANRDVFWVKFVEQYPGEYGCEYSPDLRQLSEGNWGGEAFPPPGLDYQRDDAYLAAWGNGKL